MLNTLTICWRQATGLDVKRTATRFGLAELPDRSSARAYCGALAQIKRSYTAEPRIMLSMFLLVWFVVAGTFSSPVQGQVTYDPHKRLTLPRLLMREGQSIVQNVQQMQASIVAASQALQQSRAAYWQCHPQCPDTTAQDYARRLVAKDMWYLMKAQMRAPGVDGVTGAAGSLDGGVHYECLREFSDWTRIVAEGAGSMPGAPGVMNTLRLQQGLEHARSEYDKYADCRDVGEFKRSPQQSKVRAQGEVGIAPMPADRGVGPTPHALVCSPGYIASGAKFDPPGSRQLEQEAAQKRRVAQMLGDSKSELRSAMAKGALPIALIGTIDTPEPTLSIEYAPSERYWGCPSRGGYRGMPAAPGGSDALRAASHALTCWPTYPDRGETQPKPESPQAKAHYDGLLPKVQALLRDPNGEFLAMRRSGKIPVVVIGEHGLNDPDIKVEEAFNERLREQCMKGRRPVFLATE